VRRVARYPLRLDRSFPTPKSLNFFEHAGRPRAPQPQGRADFSGVWRFRELMPFYRSEDQIVTIGEGRTVLQTADLLAGS
jgi:hypothetical protein